MGNMHKNTLTLSDAIRISKPLKYNLMIKTAGPMCNLNCDYCYYLDKSIFYQDRKMMPLDLLEKIIKEYNPDIVIITGHDAFYKNNKDNLDKKKYKNSEYFIRAVNEARKYEKSHEKLVIIAGACQSDYESLIKAGANYASSPKRVNIHALDPAIIAVTIALTERNKEIDLKTVLEKTKYGKAGMGGIIGNGLMYVGYPR